MPATPEAQPRQKRVLPSRSRRGGPGVGTCDVDLMILDTYKRKSENEPLIPADTKFLLTTDSSLLLPSFPSTSGETSTKAVGDERYFDRPEVLNAAKEQQVIQTPEFTLLSEDASVGGRFRPRGSEEESADTSDAAYEKRHRKYETFEKRQRLREKEKLKHEQYKLKERIEQLRAMDGSAFLTLPNDYFLPIPAPPEDDADDSTSQEGASTHNEGERRRKEMLDVAFSLEERYRTLLPSDRKPAEKYGGAGSVSAEPEPVVASGSDHWPHGDGGSDGDSEAAVAEITRKETQKIKLKIKFPPRDAPGLIFSASGKHTKPVKHSSKTQLHRPSPSPSSSMPYALPARDHGSSDPADSISHKRAAKRLKRSVHDADAMDEEEYGQSASAHISRSSDSGHHRSRSGGSECVLMKAAILSSGTQNTRKTQRHITAFGTKVPQEIEMYSEFELPEWIHPDYQESLHEALYDTEGPGGHRWSSEVSQEPHVAFAVSPRVNGVQASSDEEDELAEDSDG
ncbi:hypothetical protein PLICRDRAFT_121862 [Plicaturopsis crispa FD-325 SS-3]|nr:hypothetical protein PLICRDRAFT_121862 [Plicaturopsis crispa FD-325 SS-3]